MKICHCYSLLLWIFTGVIRSALIPNAGESDQQLLERLFGPQYADYRAHEAQSARPADIARPPHARPTTKAERLVGIPQDQSDRGATATLVPRAKTKSLTGIASEATDGQVQVPLGITNVFVLGTQTITANPTGFDVGTTVISPGAPAVTIDGTAVSLDSSSHLILNTLTYTISNPNVIVVGSKTLTGNPTGFVIGTSKLTPGGTVVYSGETFSLATGGVVIIKASKTTITQTLGTSINIPPVHAKTTVNQESGTGISYVSSDTGAFEDTAKLTVITEGSLTQTYTKETDTNFETLKGTTTIETTYKTTSGGHTSTQTNAIIIGPGGIYWNCLGLCIGGLGGIHWGCIWPFSCPPGGGGGGGGGGGPGNNKPTTASKTGTETSSESSSETGAILCGQTATATGSTKIKRDVPEKEKLANLQALKKREFKNPSDPPWNGDQVAFMVAQCDPSVCTRVPQVLTLTTSLVRALGSTAFNMAVTKLYGCTVVIVVSQNTVFMAHIWEFPAFTNNGEARFANNFQEEAIDYFGSTQGSIRGTAFAGAVSVLILSPRPRGSPAGDPTQGNYLYNAQVDQIETKLKTLLGGVVPTQLYYSPVQPVSDAADEADSLGKILFQYDPKANDCDPPQAGARIWVEAWNTPVWQRYWASPNAGTGKRSLVKAYEQLLGKRQDTASACTLGTKSSATGTGTDTGTKHTATTKTKGGTTVGGGGGGTTSTAPSSTPTARVVLTYYHYSQDKTNLYQYRGYDDSPGEATNYCNAHQDFYVNLNNEPKPPNLFPTKQIPTFSTHGETGCVYLSLQGTKPGTLSCPGWKSPVVCVNIKGIPNSVCANPIGTVEGTTTIEPLVECQWGNGQ